MRFIRDQLYEYKNAKKWICIAIIFIYFIVSYCTIKYFWDNNIFISMDDLTVELLPIRIMNDVSLEFIPVIILMSIWKERENYDIKIKIGLESVISVIFLTLYFIIRHEYSIAGVYKLLFYVFCVAASEEIVFRGYVYHVFRERKWCGIIISGLLWGGFHAIIPNITNGGNIYELLTSSINYVGGGIISGMIFLFFQKKRKSILPSVLLHASLDYSVGAWGILNLIIAFIVVKEYHVRVFEKIKKDAGHTKIRK